jgi:alkanesulfonate monooxygenase SsuD/methylene tetrahydromethanopterin reductase-like flavin-dependent oxidoreductase (luciferase family)
MIDRVAVAGTPSEVREKLTHLVEAGARHLVFAPATESRADADTILHLLLDEVMPAVAAP